MLKRIIFTLVLCGASLVLANAVKAETISNFSSDIQVQTDGSIKVQETIQYDFGDLQRHGIFRDIYLDSAGVNPKLVIDEITVDDGQGQPQPFSLSQTSGQLEIKIGDPNRLITGSQVYRLHYRVQNALGSFSDHDELYWDVTGNEWHVPIQQASAQIFLPSDEPVAALSVYCYAGPAGSKTQCQQARIDTDPQGYAYSSSFTQSQLVSGEGLTVAFGWPKGLVTITAAYHNLFLDYLYVVVPLLVFLILFGLWWRFGRDDRGRGTIIPQYEPPADLLPIEGGLVWDEQSKPKHLVGQIIYLAEQGYIKISRVKKVIALAPDTYDFQFDRLKEADAGLDAWSRIILAALFNDQKDLIVGNKIVNITLPLLSKVSEEQSKTSILLSDLDPSASLRFKRMQKDLSDSLKERSYFVFSPTQVRSLFAGLGFGMLIVAIYGTRDYLWSWHWLLALGSSALMIMLFGLIMPARTKKGAEAREYLAGLKLYLTVAEKDRLEFHNAPEKNPQVFEKLLPYAIVLGVEKQWAKQFEHLMMPMPRWYSDPSATNFNSLIFINQLGRLSTDVSSVVAPRGSSTSGLGGGGFSGGGGGGGGGGSW
jgi:uncharacterized membrane protein